MGPTVLATQTAADCRSKDVPKEINIIKCGIDFGSQKLADQPFQTFGMMKAMQLPMNPLSLMSRQMKNLSTLRSCLVVNKSEKKLIFNEALF